METFKSNSILEISHLTKTYKGGDTAVKDLSISLEPGDIYGFIGANGAGKTTTIKCTVGILEFESGSIRIDGHDIQKEPLACKKLFSYIPDNPDLFDQFTGIQYLNFIADVFSLSQDERTKKIQQYSQAFGLVDALGDLISTYSHGMKQKLAIIASLIHSPKLFIMDEPFVGLDPESTFKFKEIMRDFVSNGNAIFFSTHVLDTAEKLCNKIAIIKKGQLIASGDIKTLTHGESLESCFMEYMHE
jgi:ABC-2 type transport system ATP-binding protein